MHPTIIVIGKYLVRLGSLILVWQQAFEKEKQTNYEFKFVKFPWKFDFLFVAEGLGK